MNKEEFKKVKVGTSLIKIRYLNGFEPEVDVTGIDRINGKIYYRHIKSRMEGYSSFSNLEFIKNTPNKNIKLQAGMAFECKKLGKGRIVKIEDIFYLQFLTKFNEVDFLEVRNDIENLEITNFRIIPITLELLRVGDVIKRVDKQRRKVLGRLSDLIFVSNLNEFNVNSLSPFLIAELKKHQYTVIQPEWEEEVKKMTHKEIEKELGYDFEAI